MQTQHTTTHSTNGRSAVSVQPTATEKLERVRQRIRSAARQIQASEGRTLDFDTAEEIGRTLSLALCGLRELTITLAVLERRRGGK